MARRRPGRESGPARSLLETDAALPTAADAADRRPRNSDDSPLKLMAEEPKQTEETVVKPVKKTREVYDIDDDYWGAIYNEPKPAKKKTKKALEEVPVPSPSPSPQPAPLPNAAAGAPGAMTPEQQQQQELLQMPPYTGEAQGTAQHPYPAIASMCAIQPQAHRQFPATRNV